MRQETNADQQMTNTEMIEWLLKQFGAVTIIHHTNSVSVKVEKWVDDYPSYGEIKSRIVHTETSDIVDVALERLVEKLRRQSEC